MANGGSIRCTIIQVYGVHNNLQLRQKISVPFTCKFWWMLRILVALYFILCMISVNHLGSLDSTTLSCIKLKISYHN